MRDICNVLPPKPAPSGIEYSHFIYEMALKRLKQPFCRQSFALHLVSRGTGKLITAQQTLPLSPGTLFFTFPSQSYRIEGEDRFAYLYVTFHGADALPLLESFGVTKTGFLFCGYAHLTDFWMKAVRRITAANANALTESVLLFTLSYLPEQRPLPKQDSLEELIAYLANHFSDPDLTLIKAADLFGYEKKYLSSLFKRRTGTRFTDHLTSLRVEHAKHLLAATDLSVAQIAGQSGFADPFYFSKLFKSKTQTTPGEYRQKSKNAAQK